MSEPKYKVGEIVNYSCNGNNWGDCEILGMDKPFAVSGEPRYFVAPSDTPWFAISESDLTLSQNQRRIAPVGFAELVMPIMNGHILTEVYRRNGMLKQHGVSCA